MRKIAFLLVAGAIAAAASIIGPFNGAAQAKEFPAWWNKLPSADQEWAKKAKLGPYAEKGGPNWAEIERLAKKEGKVVVYSQSSRIKKAAKKFRKKYPGIEVVPFPMYVSDLIARWKSEISAGV